MRPMSSARNPRRAAERCASSRRAGQRDDGKVRSRFQVPDLECEPLSRCGRLRAVGLGRSRTVQSGRSPHGLARGRLSGPRLPAGATLSRGGKRGQYRLFARARSAIVIVCHSKPREPSAMRGLDRGEGQVEITER